MPRRRQEELMSTTCRITVNCKPEIQLLISTIEKLYTTIESAAAPSGTVEALSVELSWPI